MKMLEFSEKIHGDDVKLKEVQNIMDGSWGMDGDCMGKHGRWVDAAET
jgi:hypothetical protein